MDFDRRLFGFDSPPSAYCVVKGVNSFSLMAIPFFILAGEVMSAGSISERLFKLAKSLVGQFRGGLAHVNVLGR